MTATRMLPRRLPTEAAEAQTLFTSDFFARVGAALLSHTTIGPLTERERFLSRSIDHNDFQNRVRAWDAHEVRVRQLPAVL